MRFPAIPRWGYSLWQTALVLAVALAPIVAIEIWTLR